MSPQLAIEYLGARATPELVNRKQILNTIQMTLDSAECRVVYITGKGGMGKTRLLRDILQRCAPGGEWFRPGLLSMWDVLDLYHTHTHVQDGFAQSILDALSERAAQTHDAQSLKKCRVAFGKYQEAYNHFEKSKYHLAGMLKELSELRDQVAQEFVNALNALAQSYHLVLAIDTAEKLFYETDEIQQAIELGEEGIAVLSWLLKKVLPVLRNATILVAGRPDPESGHKRLRKDLKAALRDCLIERNLDRFELEDTQDYFRAAARAVEQEGQAEEAKRIEGIPPETQTVIWRYTGGRPIRLALMIDYLLESQDLLPQVKDPPEIAYKRTDGELATIQQDIEQDLVRFWEETRRATNLAIITLAWARKGMDAELLARAADLKRDEMWDIEKAQQLLDAIRGLSFVKTRSFDGRFFLHDEMYDLLDRYVLARVPEIERERVHAAILKYYEERVGRARKRVFDLGQPHLEKMPEWERVPLGVPKPPDDPRALAAAMTELYNLMAEEVHYRLRHNSQYGYQVYYHYAQEAHWASEDTLDLLLRSEILDFLTILGAKERIEGLRYSEPLIDTGLRWVTRNTRRRAYATAVSIAERLRTKCESILDDVGALAWARLDSQQGEAMTYQGIELERAKELLTSAVSNLQTLGALSGFEGWQRDVLLAEAFNNLGYLYRTRGQFQDAIDTYEKAIPLWRKLGEREPATEKKGVSDAQHANTLNNLAWACAEVGEFSKAERYCLDALHKRQQLGPLAPVAFSLNTLGLILMRDDKPHRAKVHCERALGIFRDLGQPRGVGLACIALAEVYRRMSDVPDLYAPEESADLLKQAARHAQEAVEIFDKSVPERPRKIEALLELGCVYRQWAWLRPSYTSVTDNAPHVLAQNSEEALRQAIQVAGEDLLHRGVDAHVNLAWLYYYVRDNEKARAEAETVIQRIDQRYHITSNGWPDQSLPQAFFWVQLGKACLLLGQIAFREFQRSQGPAHLEKAARYYTLALAYNELFAPDFRDVRRGQDRIYDRLKGLNTQEFQAVYQGIRQAIYEYSLPTPTRMQQFLKDFGLPEMPGEEVG